MLAPVFAGNINQLVLRLEPYVQQLRARRGLISEFVNPKYRDDTRTAFKSATRLECMMQVGSGCRVSRWHCNVLEEKCSVIHHLQCSCCERGKSRGLVITGTVLVYTICKAALVPVLHILSYACSLTCTA